MNGALVTHTPGEDKVEAAGIFPWQFLYYYYSNK